MTVFDSPKAQREKNDESPKAQREKIHELDRLSWSVNGLTSECPSLSAKSTTTVRQRVVALIFALACISWLAVASDSIELAFAVVTTLVYAVVVAHRFTIVVRGLQRQSVIVIDDAEALSIPPQELPPYTVLVPAYHEARVLPALLAALKALDYPGEKLDVKLLLEVDDEETLAAAARAQLPGHIEIVRVPQSKPTTKPKACNFGLTTARGQFVTIYDAEDQPEPLQLRRAVAAFRRSPREVACLQARLAFRNSNQNVLTAWFTNEYDVWFGAYLPGLVTTGAPIPLGGTSNHIRRDVLDAVGAWDPFNVTEDADLGIRLAREGWRTSLLDSVTYEEANSDVVNWVRQRSRWYKGFLQTWLVHMRQPRLLLQQLGWRGFVGFNLFVGGTPVLALLNPVFWLMAVLWWVLGHPNWMAAMYPAPLYHLAMGVWLGGAFAFTYLACTWTRHSGRPELAPVLLLLPAYWFLMSLAGVKAFVQLVAHPSFWEKTVHGLDRVGSRAVELARQSPS